MIQTDLIPTTNTLSGINDTITQVAKSLTDSGLVTVAEQISNSSSSRQIGLTIAIIGLLIFTAHLFSEIFSRKRIPDVLFLIIIGLLIGPVFHWLSPDSLGNAGSLFSGITLVTILFESGTQLRFSALKDSFRARILAIVNGYDNFRTTNDGAEPLTHNEAINRIRLWSGTHYDPELVEAFLNIERQIGEIRFGTL